MIYTISDLHGYPVDKLKRLLKTVDFSNSVIIGTLLVIKRVCFRPIKGPF